MHSESATHKWDNFIKEGKDPFLVYKKIRDQAYMDGKIEYAEIWENEYLVLLRESIIWQKETARKKCAKD